MSLDSFNAWMAANPEWLGLAIFLIAFLECAAIVGIVLPGVVLLFGVAVIAGSGALGLGETLLLAYAGGVLGDLSSYWIGRRFHQNIRRLPGLRSHPQWITAAEVYFERYGIASLLVGRFIGALRPMLPMVAGMLDMPFGRFLGVSLIAAAGWAVAYLLPGWATGAALRLPLPEGFWSEAGIVAACLAVLVGVVVQASLRRKRWATAVAAALSLVLLLAMTVAWPYLQDLDQGLMSLPWRALAVGHRRRRPARHYGLRRQPVAEPAPRVAAGAAATGLVAAVAGLRGDPGDRRRLGPAGSHCALPAAVRVGAQSIPNSPCRCSSSTWIRASCICASGRASSSSLRSVSNGSR